MATLPYKMIDADQHIYETDDCFTQYLPKKYFPEGRAVHVVRATGEAQGRILLGDRKISFSAAIPAMRPADHGSPSELRSPECVRPISSSSEAAAPGAVWHTGCQFPPR
jgi:hypothetical protein